MHCYFLGKGTGRRQVDLLAQEMGCDGGKCGWPIMFFLLPLHPPIVCFASMITNKRLDLKKEPKMKERSLWALQRIKPAHEGGQKDL